MSRTLAAVAKSPEEIDRALTVLAYYGGNAERAAAELGNVSARTLRTWRSSVHRDRYLAIAEREGPRLEALAAHNARELLIRASHVEHEIIDRLHEKTIDETTGLEVSLSAKELGDLAGALQRVTTSKGINTTKLLELTGRPTAIVEHRDPRQAAQALARRLGVTLEAQSEDLTKVPLLPEKAVANVREAAFTPQSQTAAPD